MGNTLKSINQIILKGRHIVAGPESHTQRLSHLLEILSKLILLKLILLLQLITTKILTPVILRVCTHHYQPNWA